MDHSKPQDHSTPENEHTGPNPPDLSTSQKGGGSSSESFGDWIGHEKSLPFRKLIVIATLSLLILSVIIWVVTSFVDQRKPKPLLFQFEGVKEMEEIDFVQQQYSEIIPITSKEGKLEYLLTVPATVMGKMDMATLEYKVADEDLLQITLPEVLLSDAEVNLEEVHDYYGRNTSIRLFLSGGGKAYGKAYESIMAGIENAKKGILANALKNNIIAQTRMQARSYILRIAKSIGFRVQFVEQPTSGELEKTLKKRIGGKLWREVKHKLPVFGKRDGDDNAGGEMDDNSRKESK